MPQKMNQEALDLLKADALKIEQLISNQKNSLCIAHCKAFEEVVDTQMYGFSKQVDFAIRLNAITKKQGQEILTNLEQRLNELYTNIYDASSDTQEV